MYKVYLIILRVMIKLWYAHDFHRK